VLVCDPQRFFFQLAQTGFSNSFEIAMMRVGMTFAALAMVASTVAGETWAQAGPTGPQGPEGPAGVTGS
jgi:hypothetical protein